MRKGSKLRRSFVDARLKSYKDGYCDGMDYGNHWDVSVLTPEQARKLKTDKTWVGLLLILDGEERCAASWGVEPHGTDFERAAYNYNTGFASAVFRRMGLTEYGNVPRVR